MTGIIIQARSSSVRLPNKILLDFYGGASILGILLKRIQENVQEPIVIVATTLDGADDRIASISEQLGAKAFRGSSSDVLSRFVQAAETFGCSQVVRVCADNPFLSISAINQMLQEDPNIDYVSYEAAKQLPAIRSHLGLYAERVSVAALKEAQSRSNDKADREHVTKYIYENPGSFSIKWLKPDPSVYGRDDIRFTVDDATDFELMQQLYSHAVNAGEQISIAELVRFVDANASYINTMKSQIAKYAK